ncbi:MAG: hypothetical protein KDC67_12940, partial [Ignavibacteriae bacterium]|nr:hypothetical protein [Ignavibacteriota bacterium]
RMRIKTNYLIYPIKGNYNGFYVEIDKYKGYFIANYKEVYNSNNSKYILKCKNLTYSNFKQCLSLQLLNMYTPENTSLTRLKISFCIDLETDVTRFLKTHLIMHKFNYYNLNKVPGKKRDFIKFDYDNFSIELSTCNCKSRLKNEKAKLKVTWYIKDSSEINFSFNLNVADLLIVENLEGLFSLYIKRFDELIIIDKSKISKILDLKEKELMTEYTTYGFWKSLDKYRRHRHKKTFLGIVEKYELDTINVFIRNSLIRELTNFINN